MSVVKRLVPVLFVTATLFISPGCGTAFFGERGPSTKQVQEPRPPEVFLRDGNSVSVESWVDDLEIPWSLVFLGDGRALVTERDGRIRLIRDGELQKKPYLELDAAHVGEGGMMGLAVHPDFPRTPSIYVMYTYETGDDLFNRVEMVRDEGDTGSAAKVIIDDIPGGSNHDGGRLAFGPDNMLYITTGDAGEARLAQDLESTAGKILRVSPDGEIPDDNPFEESPVYSYGHRNSQGLAWHPETGVMFASEHGPSGSGGLFAHDEINIIEKGKNYGWPEVIGKAGKKEYVDPIVVWPDEAVPPGGLVFRGGDLYLATLGSQALVRIELKENDGSYVAQRIERWFANEGGESRYGRLRDVVVGPDGALYVLTSNRDGRGNPRDGDDHIYRLEIK